MSLRTSDRDAGANPMIGSLIARRDHVNFREKRIAINPADARRNLSRGDDRFEVLRAGGSAGS